MRITVSKCAGRRRPYFVAYLVEVLGINLLSALGLLLYVGMALFLLTPMVRAARRQKLQGEWPRVAGLVTAHRLLSEKLTSCRDFRVQFQYDGKAYDRWVSDPDRKWEHRRLTPKLHIQKVLREGMEKLAPVGSHLPVMINPEDPNEAYYVDTQLPAKVIAIAAATVFALFFALFVYLALQP